MKTSHVVGLAALAALALLAIGAVAGYKWREKDTSPVDLTAILKERDALAVKLVEAEGRENALIAERNAVLVKADAATAGHAKAADTANARVGEHRARARVLETAPLDTGIALQKALAKHFPGTTTLAGGYFFTEMDAGQAVRFVEKHQVCLETGAELARGALSLRAQIEAMGTARGALEAKFEASERKVALYQGHLEARDALLERGKVAYEAEVAECRADLRKARWTRRLWQAVAVGALAGGLYLDAQ